MLLEAVNKATGEQKLIHSLIETDGISEWFIRYTWVQNTVDNEKYISNYFTEGADKGLNIRVQSTHLNQYWEGFNRYMGLAARSGNLVWRVKVLNEVNRSIDYIEIWRDPKYIEEIYSKSDVTLSDGYLWAKDSKTELYYGTVDIGFQKWNLMPTLGISKKKAIEHYRKFVYKWELKENCLINTPYTYRINPYLSVRSMYGPPHGNTRKSTK